MQTCRRPVGAGLVVAILGWLLWRATREEAPPLPILHPA